eukprot:Gregarina_sp_Pseudo_9__1894@NODE_22_length_5725_cov_32_771720_g20_i0_p3_GENE_NODE_22_length_5725_cov_32_771720_g20_i0NODE_22_length_5725_cov_32_771720_g20_i0_p3_ORF_typecomplete_len203_score22_06Yip1/PF04893_17/1_3e27DUF998/PF06197_13/0_76YIF1/PF03878_15/4_4_NODE_22_length_5725_cov_32_771720_g20_i0269877
MLPTTTSARTFQSGDGDGSNTVVDEMINEPIFDTVMRDVKAVGDKFKYVMLPVSRQEKGGILKQWDLWGPLFLSLILSTILWTQADDDQKRAVFALAFTMGWLGAGVVTLNASMLGANISFFQAVSVLGYCLFPICCSALICLLIPHAVNFLRIVAVGLGVYWAIGASTSFMASFIHEDKKLLATYPVWLFYVVFAWLIVLM